MPGLPIATLDSDQRTLLRIGLVLLLAAFLLRALAARSPWTLLTLAPTTLHVAAMSLITVSLLRPRPSLALLACGFWTAASVFLECFEHEGVEAWAIRDAPLWLLAAARELVSWRQVGLTRGFHVAEAMAALAGGVLAFLFLRARSVSRTLTFGGTS